MHPCPGRFAPPAAPAHRASRRTNRASSRGMRRSAIFAPFDLRHATTGTSNPLVGTVSSAAWSLNTKTVTWAQGDLDFSRQCRFLAIADQRVPADATRLASHYPVWRETTTVGEKSD